MREQEEPIRQEQVTKPLLSAERGGITPQRESTAKVLAVELERQCLPSLFSATLPLWMTPLVQAQPVLGGRTMLERKTG